jgi:hypothetical protein
MLVKFEMTEIGVRMSIPGPPTGGDDRLVVFFDEQELITALEKACSRFHMEGQPHTAYVRTK